MNNQTEVSAADEFSEKIEGVDIAPGRKTAPQESSKTAADANEGSIETENQGELIESLTKDLDEAKREVQELKDAWARERAEFINFKKRSSAELGKSRVYAVSKFAGSLLSVLDNLDRVLGVKSSDGSVASFLEGVQMIRQEFVSVLERENIKAIQPVDAPFDPFIMEAIASEEREGLETDTVVDVYQAGYYMEYGDGEKQIIRPARVRVGKAPSAAKKQEVNETN